MSSKKRWRATILAASLFAFYPFSRGFSQTAGAVVKARLLLATDGAHAGSTVQVAAVAEVQPGYHLNDHKPSLDYLIPTELKLEDSKQLTVEKTVYPTGQRNTFAFSDTPLSVYQGTVVVGALLKVARKVGPGTYSVKGKFSYQACNDHACLPPASVPLAAEVKVVRPGVRLKTLNRDVFDRVKFD